VIEVKVYLCKRGLCKIFLEEVGTDCGTIVDEQDPPRLQGGDGPLGWRSPDCSTRLPMQELTVSWLANGFRHVVAIAGYRVGNEGDVDARDS
jgi:hypothetical protein